MNSSKPLIHTIPYNEKSLETPKNKENLLNESINSRSTIYANATYIPSPTVYSHTANTFQALNNLCHKLQIEKNIAENLFFETFQEREKLRDVSSKTFQQMMSDMYKLNDEYKTLKLYFEELQTYYQNNANILPEFEESLLHWRDECNQQQSFPWIAYEKLKLFIQIVKTLLVSDNIGIGNLPINSISTKGKSGNKLNSMKTPIIRNSNIATSLALSSQTSKCHSSFSNEQKQYLEKRIAILMDENKLLREEHIQLRKCSNPTTSISSSSSSSSSNPISSITNNECLNELTKIRQKLQDDLNMIHNEYKTPGEMHNTIVLNQVNNRNKIYAKEYSKERQKSDELIQRIQDQEKELYKSHQSNLILQRTNEYLTKEVKAKTSEISHLKASLREMEIVMKVLKHQDVIDYHNIMKHKDIIN